MSIVMDGGQAILDIAYRFLVSKGFTYNGDYQFSALGVFSQRDCMKVVNAIRQEINEISERSFTDDFTDCEPFTLIETLDTVV